MRKLIAVAVLLAGAVILWPSRSQAKGPCAVPKAWGELRTLSFAPGLTEPFAYMVFEDQAGTVRVLFRNRCKPEPDFEVTRSE